MDAIKCKTCDTGTLAPRKVYRMSGIVVVIGYILLIPSIIGVLVSVVGLFGVGFAGSDVMETQRTAAQAQMQQANVPAPLITKVTQLEGLAVADTARLTGRQRTAVRQAHLRLTASTLGTGGATALAGGLLVLFGIGSLVGGLLGWLLVMRKRILKCDRCGAVVAAS